MYNFSLLLGLLFAVYVAILVITVVRRHEPRETTLRSKRPRDPMILNEQQEDLVADAKATDEDGSTVVTWRMPIDQDVVSAKIYARVSNNPAAAVSRREIPRSDNVFESVTLYRNGKRHWYWITLVYKNGKESEKQFIDVVPNTDD